MISKYILGETGGWGGGGQGNLCIFVTAVCVWEVEKTYSYYGETEKTYLFL